MTVTVTALQSALGTGPYDAKIIRSTYASATAWHYVVGNADAGGRARWCAVTRSNSAAAQATEVLAVLVDGY